MLMPKLIDDPLDDGNCIWDYLFAVWHDTAKNLDDWKDVMGRREGCDKSQ